MKKLLIFPIFLISLVFNSCQDDESLPPITMEGRNTFGCLVNGKLWLPKGSFNVPPTSAHYDMGLFLTIGAGNNDSGFSFLLKDPVIVNQLYNLTDTSTIKAYYEKNINNFFCIYDDYHVLSGTLKISRFDLQNSVLSGIFEFTTYNAACGDTIKITEGRFDIADITY